MLAKQHKFVLIIKLTLYIPTQQGHLLLKIQEKIGIITCNYVIYIYF